MGFKESLSALFRAECDVLADDLTKAFDMPFEVSKQTVLMKLTDTTTGKLYELKISLREL